MGTRGNGWFWKGIYIGEQTKRKIRLTPSADGSCNLKPDGWDGGNKKVIRARVSFCVR